MKMLVRSLCVVTLMTTLSACGTIRTTNNFSERGTDIQKIYSVSLITQAQLVEYNYRHLGLVTTTYCQYDRDSDEYNQSAILNTLRSEAESVGGNAVIYNSCRTSPSAGCYSYSICTGNAYHIEAR